MNGFEEFWKRYPRKIGRLVAQKAYEKALKQATHEQIMAGVDLYREHLPEDAQYICHPSTFLNQGRWLDEYEDAVTLSKLKKARPELRAVTREQMAWWGCEHEPMCGDWKACLLKKECQHEPRCWHIDDCRELRHKTRAS